MSIHRDVWVKCDICGESCFADGDLTDTQARKLVKTDCGMKRIKHEGVMKDVCSSCFDGLNSNQEKEVQIKSSKEWKPEVGKRVRIKCPGCAYDGEIGKIYDINGTEPSEITFHIVMPDEETFYLYDGEIEKP